MEKTAVLPENNLDVLRAVAVMGVIIDHIMRLFTKQIGPITYWQAGTFGVFMFFVHTSLVLMSSLERQRGQQSMKCWIASFYIRRAFRIYPLAWAAIILTVLLRLAHLPAGFTHRDLAANLLLMQNVLGAQNALGVLWTLPLELQMYLLLPLAFLVARKNLIAMIMLFCGGWALSTFEWYVLRGFWPQLPVLWRLEVVAYIPCFASGMLAYTLLLKQKPILPSWLFPVVISASLATFVMLTRPARLWTGWPACLLIGCLIPVVEDSGENIMTRGARIIAKYSYGIYLLHSFAIAVAWDVMAQYAWYLRLSVFMSLVILLPTLAYHLIEEPGITMGRTLAGLLSAKRPSNNNVR